MTFESVKNQLISDLKTKTSESTGKDSIGYLQIEGYMCHNNNLESLLDAGHPYRNNPPEV